MRAKRTDTNQKQIVEDLRDLGLSVFLTHEVGRGFPDLVVGTDGETYLVEIKRPAGPRGGLQGKKQNEEQIAFAERWKGGAVIVARSTEEVLEGIEHQLGTTIRTAVN
jgi:Holliday junction resolvase